MEVLKGKECVKKGKGRVSCRGRVVTGEQVANNQSRCYLLHQPISNNCVSVSGTILISFDGKPLFR
jgi:hypothetical protein